MFLRIRRNCCSSFWPRRAIAASGAVEADWDLAPAAARVPAELVEAVQAGAAARAAEAAYGKQESPERRQVAAAQAAEPVAPAVAEDLGLAEAQAVEGPVVVDLAEEPGTERVEEQDRAAVAARAQEAKAEPGVEDLEQAQAAAQVEQGDLAVDRVAAAERGQDQERGQVVGLVAAAAEPVSQENGSRPLRCSRAECWGEYPACREEWRAARAAMG